MGAYMIGLAEFAKEVHKRFLKIENRVGKIEMHIPPKDEVVGIQAPEHIMQFFAYAHLPPVLQDISKPFGLLAETLFVTLPRNPERTVALRKLLEAKDAAVRASIAK